MGIENQPFRIGSPIFHSTFVCDNFDKARETLARLFGAKAYDGGVWAGRRATFVAAEMSGWRR